MILTSPRRQNTLVNVHKSEYCFREKVCICLFTNAIQVTLLSWGGACGLSRACLAQSPPIKSINRYPSVCPCDVTTSILQYYNPLYTGQGVISSKYVRPDFNPVVFSQFKLQHGYSLTPNMTLGVVQINSTYTVLPRESLRFLGIYLGFTCWISCSQILHLSLN